VRWAIRDSVPRKHVTLELGGNAAVAAGGRVLTGGVRDRAAYAPTVLTGVPSDAKVSCKEVVGPVVAGDRRFP
jgi:hypothetical protein